MDLDFVSVHKHAKKELGQYPAILTSHLVNNPYIFPAFSWGIFGHVTRLDQSRASEKIWWIINAYVREVISITNENKTIESWFYYPLNSFLENLNGTKQAQNFKFGKSIKFLSRSGKMVR